MDPRTLETTTLTARGVDDLLGYAGHALGTLPQRSLVLVTLAGTRLRAVVRVDLPAHADPGPGWAPAVAGVCRQDVDADGTLLLALDPVPDHAARPAAARPAPSLREAPAEPGWWSALCAELARAGLPAREGWASTEGRAWAWGVPDDGLGGGLRGGADGIADHAAGCAPDPDGARPVSPRTSALSLHLLARGSVWGRRDRDLLVPPPPAAVAAASRWAAPDPRDTAARTAWLGEWAAVLRGGSAADLPRLGGPLVHPAWRDELVLQASCGEAAPPEDRRERGDILTAASSRAPHWPGLDRLWEECRRIAASAPDRPGAQALAVAAWVSWARGHGSAAAAHLEAAAERDSGDALASLLRQVVEAGLVAGWASSPDTAWRA